MALKNSKAAKPGSFNPIEWLNSLGQPEKSAEAATPAAAATTSHPTRRLAADHKVKPSKKARAARAKAQRLNTTRRRSH